MKQMKRKIAVLIAAVLLAAVALTGCGGGGGASGVPVLKTVYPDLAEYAKSDYHFAARYDEATDILQLDFYEDADVEAVFKILNSGIEGKHIGSIMFCARYGPDEDTMQRICDGIGSLSCESMEMLGVDTQILTCCVYSWLDVLPKVERLYVPNAVWFDRYNDEQREKIACVKTVWTEDAEFRGIDAFSGLEEVGIHYTMDFSKIEGEEPASEAAEEDADGEEAAIEPVTFNEDYDRAEFIFPLRNCPTLQRVIIAPDQIAYVPELRGMEFICAISQVRPDLLINPPEQPLSRDNLVQVTELTDAPDAPFHSSMATVYNDFVLYDVQDCYEKATAFTVKDGLPKLTGKALVYMGTPDTTGYTEDRVLHSRGKVLTADELGTGIAFPERTGDYDFFVYAYPTYKQVGVYSLGTEAYQETYYVQVFDMKNQAAYKPQLVVVADPPQTISTSGTPARWSGHVDEDEIYEAIRKMAE
ncbi:MAG: hypothetical protein IJH91_06345 [Mogibacterium sp.]|nr:hypothetical protein [Mogibacterium sp.]